MDDIDVKDIILKLIKSDIANKFVKKYHYSGKVVQNSTLHFGAFYNNVLHGVLSYGNSIDKRKIQKLVKNTNWNDFIELNRMAFDDFLPKNSESRCISISIKLIKKHYPNIKWIISFADGTQCGDGTIYRASGFLLTKINKNKQMLLYRDKIIARKTLDNKNFKKINGKYMSGVLIGSGEAIPLQGFQLRYIYFIDKSYKENLTVPILPFSEIDKKGARMYLGKSCPHGVINT